MSPKILESNSISVKLDLFFIKNESSSLFKSSFVEIYLTLLRKIKVLIVNIVKALGCLSYK